MDNELYHYGVKGMRWGVRKKYHETLKTAKKNMYDKYDRAEANHDKRVTSINKKYGQNFYNGDGKNARMNSSTKKAYNREIEKAWDKYTRDNNKARDEYRQDKKSAKIQQKRDMAIVNKKAVKKYNEKIKEADKAQELADTKWNEVSDKYKSLGKTRITRMLNAVRNNSEAARDYNKSYNDWEKSQNLADQKWSDARKEYVNTGRNRVEQILNNIKYDK